MRLSRTVEFDNNRQGIEMLQAAVRLRILLTILTLMGAICVASAQTPTIAEINTLSGLDDALSNIGSSFTTIPPEVAKTAVLAEGFEEAWAFAADGLFDPKELRSKINERLNGQFSAAELADLYAFYNSDFGKQVTLLEVAAGKIKPDDVVTNAGREIMAELRENDPHRLALYEQMANDLAAIESAEAIAMNVGYAMLAGMFAAAQSPIAPSEQLIMQLLQGQREEIHREVEDAVLAHVAYCYKTLTIDQVNRYAQFLSADAARDYYAELFQVMSDVVADGARTFGERLATALGQRKA